MCRLGPLVVFVLLGTSASAWAKTEVFRTRSGAVVHWEGKEITLGLDRAAPSRTVPPEGVQQAVDGAVAAWNQVGGTVPRFRVVSGPAAQVRIRFCRGRWVGQKDELGRSEFIANLRTGLVTSAAIEFNECERYFAAPDEVGEERFDLQSAIAHELGHVLGLAHGSNPASLMYPTGGTGAIRSPHAEDRSALGAIYGWVPPARAGVPIGAVPSVPPHGRWDAASTAPADVVSVLANAKTQDAGGTARDPLPPLAPAPVPKAVPRK